MAPLEWFGQAYISVSEMRRFFYRHQWLHSVRVSCPVISVGNLTFGGTGKTPIVDFLLEELQKLNLKVAVVSRCYKSLNQSMKEVDLSLKKGAEFFGDEPYLLKVRHPGVSVFVGPKKYKTAQEAVRCCSPDVVIIDDGFQHLRLYRDWNIVLLDASKSLTEYSPYPRGRAREGLSSLQDADSVFLTKCNLVSSSGLEELKTILPPRKLLMFDYVLGKFWVMCGRNIEPTDSLFLVSGIGDPKSFETLIGESKILSHLIWPDHALYDSVRIEHIIKKAKEMGAQAIVTTQKDAVKMQPHLSLFEEAQLNLSWVEAKAQLHGFELNQRQHREQSQNQYEELLGKLRSLLQPRP